mgnify:CR=1 FL=1
MQLYRYMWRHKKRGLVPQLRIPRLLWEGTTDDGKQRVVVLDRLGTSLDQLFDATGRTERRRARGGADPLRGDSKGHLWVATVGFRNFLRFCPTFCQMNSIGTAPSL